LTSFYLDAAYSPHPATQCDEEWVATHRSQRELIHTISHETREARQAHECATAYNIQSHIMHTYCKTKKKRKHMKKPNTSDIKGKDKCGV